MANKPTGEFDKLISLVSRIERLEEEKREVADQIKDVYGEAKAVGYDTTAIREVIKIRKKDRDQHAELEGTVSIYMAVMDGDYD